MGQGVVPDLLVSVDKLDLGGFDVGYPTTTTTRLLRLSNRYTGSDSDVLAVPRTP